MSTNNKNRKDVDDLLADLDNLGTEQPSKPSRRPSEANIAATASPSGEKGTSSTKKGPQDAQSLLDDLNNLVQSRASSNGRLSLRKKQASTVTSETTEPVKDSETISYTTTTMSDSFQENTSDADMAGAAPAISGWAGWGSSLLSQATKLADQARQELEKRAPAQAAEQARELGNRGWDFAKGVRGFVKEAGFEKWSEEVTKVGKKGWTDIIHAVAPPISAHEVIQVTLSHDMVGYDGVEDVTYRVLAKVMEQVGSNDTEQQLVVNKAPVESSAARPKQGVEGQERDLNTVEGFEAALKLARASLDECIKSHDVKVSESAAAKQTANLITLPITTCPVFVRIQPVISPLPGFSLEGKSKQEQDQDKQLFFILLLQDPQHGLGYKTISQAIPYTWLQVPLDENVWVEDAMVDVLQNALTIIGQDYVQGRMSGRATSSKDGLVNPDVSAETMA